MEIVIAGTVYAKKNNLQFSARSKHPYYPAEVKRSLADIQAQIFSQWHESVQVDGETVRTPRPPLVNPALAFVFYVSDRGLRSDRDGKLTTILDELVNAGVLKDDCIADFNSEVLLCAAHRTDGWAGTRVFLEPAGNFGRLYRYLRNLDLGSYRIVKGLPGTPNDGKRRFPSV